MCNPMYKVNQHPRPLIKVCGLCRQSNALDVAALGPDYMGFIFFEKSLRHAGGVEHLGWIRHLPKEIKKVGVFVNAAPEQVLATVQRLNLSVVQLHGNEPPSCCEVIAGEGVEVWKAFGVDEGFSFGKTECYEPFCQGFVFDTKGPRWGGNGVPFDWSLLQHYRGHTPFLLSGGIGPEQAPQLRDAANLHPLLAGFDLNSRFEIRPGLKDAALLKTFLNELEN